VTFFQKKSMLLDIYFNYGYQSLILLFFVLSELIFASLIIRRGLLHKSKELDLTLEISLDEAGQLLMRNDRRKRLLPLEIIQRDRFLLNDYIIEVDRNDTGEMEGLLLTINRVKGVRFGKVK
jgi:hypothetical protein